MKQLLVTVGIVLAAVMVGCGGGSSSNGGTIAVSMSPTSATVQLSHTEQFSATVQNSSNTAVTWEVNGVAGGSAADGTISSGGLYTAPAAPVTVTVTAVAQADSSAAASATVTVSPPVAVSPASAAVSPNQTQQFTATVTISSNTAVTWQVNGTAGGNATVGTISSSGLYTAPASLPSPNIVKVTAVSQADSSQSASASVTITPPPLVIAPTGVVLSAGGQQTFTATALSQSVTPAWSVACASSLANGCGSITPGGVFTAPLSPPPGGVVTISASMSDGSASASNTRVTVQFSNTTLAGSYAFTLTESGQAFAAEAGSVSFDGNGGVAGGSIDRSNQGGAPVAITGGSYQVGLDGRGTAIVETAQGPLAWQLAVSTQLQVFAVGFDSAGNSASGTLQLQNPGQFGLSSIQGGYALSLRGVVPGGSPVPFAMVGSVSADGAGNFKSGLLDLSSGPTVTTSFSATGSYTAPDGSGRGTLTLSSAAGTQNFVYYQVDSTQLELVEVDGARLGAGELFLQPAGPFSTASFQGPFAFTLSGWNGAMPLAQGGVFTLNGSAGITNRQLDGMNQTVFDTQGSYFVSDAASGRTSLSWTVNNGSVLQYAMYPLQGGGFAMLEVDGVNVAAGLVYPQSNAGGGVFSLAGSYAASLAGFELSNLTSQESVTGQIVLNGQSSFSGTLDVASNGASTEGASLQAGALLIGLSNGRGTASVLTNSQALAGGSLVFYILDADRALVLESDGTRVLTGMLARQF